MAVRIGTDFQPFLTESPVTIKDRAFLIVIIYIDVRTLTSEAVERLVRHFSMVIENWEKKLPELVILDMIYPNHGEGKVDISYYGKLDEINEKFLRGLRQKMQNELLINNKSEFFEDDTD